MHLIPGVFDILYQLADRQKMHVSPRMSNLVGNGVKEVVDDLQSCLGKDFIQRANPAAGY